MCFVNVMLAGGGAGDWADMAVNAKGTSATIPRRSRFMRRRLRSITPTVQS